MAIVYWISSLAWLYASYAILKMRRICLVRLLYQIVDLGGPLLPLKYQEPTIIGTFLLIIPVMPAYSAPKSLSTTCFLQETVFIQMAVARLSRRIIG